MRGKRLKGDSGRSVFDRLSTIHMVCRKSAKNLQRWGSGFSKSGAYLRRHQYWLACCFLIITLSIYGRGLQKVVVARVDSIWIAVTIFIFLIVILLLLLKKRKTLSISYWKLIIASSILCAGGAAVYFKYLLPVETLHFLVFSCYGWASASVFGPVNGVLAVVGMAIGDEILQHYLPSRVGDFHDIVINLLSGFVGLILRNKW